MGTGTAGLTLARLLGLCDWTVDLVGSIPNRGRWITISQQTRRLIEDIWGQTVFRDGPTHTIRGRRVTWSGAKPTWVDAPVTAVETTSLAKSMLHLLTAGTASNVALHLEACPSTYRVGGQCVIDARGRSDPAREAHRVRYGARSMRVCSIGMVPGSVDPCGEIFAGEGFWSFGFPIAADRISMQVATPKPCSSSELLEMLLRSRIWHTVLFQAANAFTPAVLDQGVDFPTAPSLLLEGLSPAYLAVGDALMTLDPLCGDGTGHGLKTALLIAGVLNSANKTVSEEVALAHFIGRVRLAFRTHLELCQRFYLSIRHPSAWGDEVKYSEAFEMEAPASMPSLQLVVTGMRDVDRASGARLSVELVAQREC